jgi:hypothetical protein
MLIQNVMPVIVNSFSLSKVIGFKLKLLAAFPKVILSNYSDHKSYWKSRFVASRIYFYSFLLFTLLVSEIYLAFITA